MKVKSEKGDLDSTVGSTTEVCCLILHATCQNLKSLSCSAKECYTQVTLTSFLN